MGGHYESAARPSNGFGTYAESYCGMDLKGRGVLFTAKVGGDDEVGRNGSVIFKVDYTGSARLILQYCVIIRNNRVIERRHQSRCGFMHGEHIKL